MSERSRQIQKLDGGRRGRRGGPQLSLRMKSDDCGVAKGGDQCNSLSAVARRRAKMECGWVKKGVLGGWGRVG